MIVVGITGNFSSGKSAVTGIFKKLGAKVFDADLAAKQVVRKGTALHRAIIQIFGQQYLDKTGEINRKKLAGRVFSNPKDLRKLNILIHPEVIFEAMKMKKNFQNKKGILVFDVPLLYETKMERLANKVIVVNATRGTMISRAGKKGVGPSLSKKILATQWPAEKKVSRADFVIENNGNLKDLDQRARQIFKQIQEEAAADNLLKKKLT